MNHLELRAFLSESKYVDISSLELQGIVREHKHIYKSDRELAVALFYFVRDRVVYRLGNWNQTASQTFAHKSGTCTNKANLLVALLRIGGIPAGYGVMKVHGREYFGPALLSVFKPNISKISKHIYPFVYLNGQWLKCDPSDDKILSEATQHFNPQSTLVNWNGESDSVLKLHNDHVLSDEGPIADITDLMAKKMRLFKKTAVEVANLYLQFLREHGEFINDKSQLKRQFEKWLYVKHKWYYALYYLVFLHGHLIHHWEIWVR